MKKTLVLLLCLNIVLAPTYAFANTSLGGWTITQQIAQGASTVLNATKTTIINGASVVKTSTAKITPKASQVAKVLARGAAGYALSVAVQQLLGSVDWVLEPENNRIKYKAGAGDVYSYSNGICVGVLDTNFSKCLENHLNTTSNNGGIFSDHQCSLQTWVSGNFRRYSCTVIDTRSNTRVERGTYTVTKTGVSQGEYRYLPLETVAQRVIDNAESSTNNDHKVGAQVATTTAAEDALANDSSTQSDTRQQLETNAKTQTSEEATAESTPKDPAAPDAGTNIKITFPVFCSWAPLVCEAAQSAIKFPTTVQNWWNTATQAISASWLTFKEWLDWTKNDSELPNTETNQVTELPIPELKENAISWSASCPPDVQVPINLYGQSSTLTFSWSPWCQLLNIIKPAIIASAYIGAAFIVLGLRT